MTVASLLLACSRSAAEPNESTPPMERVEPVGELEVAATRTTVFRTHEPSPPEEAAEHVRGCDVGDRVACHAAALDLYYAEPNADGDREMAERFTKACRADYAPSCNGLGVLYREGRGVPLDLVRAAELFERSCDGGNVTGCQHLADALRRGQGIAADETLADRAEARGTCVFEASLRDERVTKCPSVRPTPP